MPGPFDLPQMPSGSGSIMDLMDPGRQRLWDAMGGLGAALLQAGAPSPYPGNFGSMLGQGLAGAANSMGASEDRSLKRALTASQVAMAKSKIDADANWTKMMGGAVGSPAPAAGGGIPQPGWSKEVGPLATPAAGPAAAIASIESNGQPNNGYGAVGPVADAKGSRAYGKYQVMDYNIGPWTQEVLGRAMTPQEFLANPQAQDQVFQTKFGQMVKQTGDPQKAAAMWFSGRPDTTATNVQDVNGVTPAAYVSKFVAAGGAAPALAGGQGDSAVPVQYTPQQPKTFQQVIDSIPPGVRQMIGAMGREAGMKEVLRYADPETVPAIDARTGQVVFAPKTQLNSGQYQPIEGARLQMDERRNKVEEANKDVLLDANGRARMNQPLLDFKKGVSAAQGTDPEGKMLLGDYEDVRKANTEMQGGALTARTGLAQTNRLASLLEEMKSTGKFTSTTQEIKQMAKGLGVNLEALGVKDDTAPAQAIQALRGQMALALRNPSQGAGMPGAMSDADRKYLDAMVAGLDNTPEGNKLIIEASRKLYQRQIDLAKIANDFMRSPEAKKDPNALYQKLQDYADKNPLFSEKDLPAGGFSPAPAGAIPEPPKGFKVLGR